MKTCNCCKETKSFEAFSKRKDAKDGYCADCKVCAKLRHAKWYQDNKEYQDGKNRVRMLERRAFVESQKMGIPCADCNQTFIPYAMDFDHVRGTKIETISRLVNRCASFETIQEEIDKCELVCAVCHRVRTWTRYQESLLTQPMPD